MAMDAFQTCDLKETLMMSRLFSPRLLPLAWFMAVVAGSLVAPAYAQSPPAPEQIAYAISRIDGMAEELMRRSGIPGMAVAVVEGDRIVYAKGFGVRAAGSPQPVDADTVFQLASMSKPIGATVVAQQVGIKKITWETPMRKHLPGFTLGNAYVSENITIGDLYAHRSGLPGHAGDMLEELGYSQQDILRSFSQLPLTPFRASYAYTNYGMTGAAMAVAAAAGTDWASLSEQVLYKPLGMVSTSSRFADFLARSNRAPGHVKENGVFVIGPERGFIPGRQNWSTGFNTDRQQPSGGVSSSARDVARWMSFVLSGGIGPGGQLVPAVALMPALTPKSITQEASARGERPILYGYGFAISTTEAGRPVLSHNGAFSWGASTNFAVMPSANLGIVVLTNAWPTGVAEGLVAQFNDLVEFRAVQKDWYAIAAEQMAGVFTPQGELAGKPRPAQPAPPLQASTGTWRNEHLGPLQVVRTGQGALELRIGAAPQLVFPLQHWDGDTYTFVPLNDSAPPGSLSKATFSGNQITLEHYNKEGLGTFTRVAAQP
jgi:CubicO group peptidase (beta-lactamase class C family)